MNISDITAEGFVNTDRLENTLVHIINEKKDSENGPLSYIDTMLFVKKFMDNYEMYFKKSIEDCYFDTYEDIFSDIATGLEENKDQVHIIEPKLYDDKGNLIIRGPEGDEIYCDSSNGNIVC